AEYFDEQDGSIHAAAEDVNVVALIIECGGLRGDDLQVGVDAADVAVVEDALGLLSRRGGGALLRSLLLKDAQGYEVVFHLLEGSEDGLLVVGGVAIEECDGLFLDATATAALEEGFADEGAKGIDNAGGIEERCDGSAFEAGSGVEVERGVKGGLCDADGLVAFGGAALCGGNVWTALEQRGWDAGRDDGR